MQILRNTADELYGGNGERWLKIKIKKQIGKPTGEETQSHAVSEKFKEQRKQVPTLRQEKLTVIQKDHPEGLGFYRSSRCI